MQREVRRYLLKESERLPLVLQAGDSGCPLSAYVSGEWRELQRLLLEHGALLFRGFGATEVADFEGFVGALPLQRQSYLYRSTPRTSVGRNIFTATEYPPSEEIPLHNENSYQRDWPEQLAFCCLQAAASGGETPLADMRRVTASIGPELVDRFAVHGVRYVRTYRDSFDLPWQTVFQTKERDELESYCRRMDIQHEWLDANTLRTSQVSQGVVRHPVTGERVFFNQAHLFHPSSLGETDAQTLISLFGSDRLPRHASFGDGCAIETAQLERVRASFAKHAVRFPWQQGDVLLIDNVQVAHGRGRYSGVRRHLAALLGSRRAAELREPS